MSLKQRRKKGIGGRVLSRDISELGLLAGDRLEPSPDLPNVFNFEELDPSSLVSVVFWPSSGDPQVKHRNLLFDAAIGVTPLSLLVDILHALLLGVLKNFAAELIWELVLSGLWINRSGRQVHEFADIAVTMVGSDLSTWFWNWHKASPIEKLTRMEKLYRGHAWVRE